MSSLNDIIILTIMSTGDYYSIDGGDGIDTLVIQAPALIENLEAIQNGMFELKLEGIGTVLVSADNFEIFQITGGAGDDTMDGSDLGDELSGGAGDDTLTGKLGSDILSGGDGDDILSVGTSTSAYDYDTGPDTIDGGEGFDRIVKLPRATLTDDQSIIINFLEAGGASFDLTDGTAVSTIEEIRGFTLGDGDDNVKIVPSALTNRHEINGGIGENHLNVTFNHFTADMYFGDIVWKSGTYSLREVGTPVVNAAVVLAHDFETMRIIAGSGDDHITAGDSSDWLEGNAGNDDLNGQGGDDTLIGGEGDDILRGFSGNNRLVGGPGADQLLGGIGIDTVNYLNSPSGVRVDISLPYEVGVGVGGDATGDTYRYIDAIDGSQFDDTLIGSYTNNLLRGAGGDDIIKAGNGNDALGGGDGNDQLFGGHGADRLYGNAGDDILYGGKNNDRFWGGTGNDTFVILDDEHTNKILDFDVTSSDLIDLSHLQITDFSTLQSKMTQVGPHVQIFFEPFVHITNPADILIIENIQLNELQPSHFQL